jgi:lipopolysaccharide export system protein LptA
MKLQSRKGCRQVAGRRAWLWFPRLLAATLALASLPVAALDDDSKQPMNIESDVASYDGRSGETVYVGNVKATQGSLKATGDKMVIFQKNGKTEKIVIFGNPARIQQTPDVGKPDNHGIGQRVDYFPDTGILILYEKAMTWEGDDPAKSEHTVTSDRIEYDTKNSVYKAGTSKSSKKRVHVTILPKEARTP